jgi:hypothetical protein
MAQAVFISVAVLAAAFFIWRKTADPLAVAFGACIVYFTPGFLGIAQFSYGRGLEYYSEPIAPAAYLTMTIVLAVLAATTAAVDLVPVGARAGFSFDRKIAMVLLGLITVFTALSIRNTNVYFLCLDKAIVLSKLDPWYYRASLSAPFLFAIAWALRWRTVALAGAVFLFADLYAGFRPGVAVAFIACLMLMEDWLRRGWRYLAAFAAIMLVGGAVLFMVKHLIEPAKNATASYCDAQLALDEKPAPAADQAASPAVAPKADKSASQPRVAGSTNQPNADKAPPPPRRSAGEALSTAASNMMYSRFYVSSFVGQSEAFVIQSILNEVVRKDFHTGAAYLVGQILTALPLGESVFGIDNTKVATFNSMVQPVLFPSLNFGLANNPWAQAYAAGGQWMVAVFAIGYALLAGILNLVFRCTKGALQAGIAVLCVWTGFYFHRNDLFIEAVLIKHVVYLFAASVAIAWIWNRIRPAVERAPSG